MASPLAALAGLLTGFNQVPKSIAAMDEDERAKQRLAQQDAQFQQTYGLQQQTRDIQQATLDEARAKRLAGEQTEVQKRADLESVRSQVPESMRPFIGIQGGPELYKALYPAAADDKPISVGSDSALYHKGQWLTPPRQETPAPQIPPGFAPAGVTIDPRGRQSTTYKPLEQDKTTEGDKRRDLIDRVLRSKGYVPGTPAYDEQMLNATRTFSVPEGGQIFGGGQIIPPANGMAPTPSVQAPIPGRPGGPTPLAAGPDKPIEAAAAQLVVGGDSARRAATEALAALKSPDVQAYIGPYAQYRSLVQGKAPNEMLGKIPPAVVQLEQNTARVKNYTIKLITGAQMSEPEAARIMKELPDLGQQPDVYAQRMQATLQNIAMMEALSKELVTRKGGGATPTPAPRPQSTPGPQGGQRQVRVRDPKTGRTGTVTLGPGEQIPAGLEVIQ